MSSIMRELARSLMGRTFLFILALVLGVLAAHAIAREPVSAEDVICEIWGVLLQSFLSALSLLLWPFHPLGWIGILVLAGTIGFFFLFLGTDIYLHYLGVPFIAMWVATGWLIAIEHGHWPFF